MVNTVAAVFFPCVADVDRTAVSLIAVGSAISGQPRVGGEFEGVLQVRLEVEPLPDPPDGRFDRPARWAIEARDQCVSLPEADSKVATMTSST